jgi:hypothetical protein
MTLSVIDPINLRYRDVIAAKKGTCEPVPNNLVTANKISLNSIMRAQFSIFLRLMYGNSYTPPVALLVHTNDLVRGLLVGDSYFCFFSSVLFPVLIGSGCVLLFLVWRVVFYEILKLYFF